MVKNSIKNRLKKFIGWEEFCRVILKTGFRYGVEGMIEKCDYGSGRLRIRYEFGSEGYYYKSKELEYHSMSHVHKGRGRQIVYWRNRLLDGVDMVIRERGWQLMINRQYKVYWRDGFYLLLYGRGLKLYIDPGYYYVYGWIGIYSINNKMIDGNRYYKIMWDGLDDIDRLVKTGFIWGEQINWVRVEVIEILGGDWSNICLWDNGDRDIDVLIGKYGEWDLSVYKELRKRYYDNRTNSYMATINNQPGGV